MDNEKRMSVIAGIGAVGLVALSYYTGEFTGLKFGEVVLLSVCVLTVVLSSSSCLILTILLAVVASVLLFLPKFQMSILPVVMVLLLSVRSIMSVKKRYSSVRPLFQNGAVWTGLMGTSNLIGAILLEDIFVILAASSASGFYPGYIVAAVMTAGMYALAFLRRVKGCSLLTSPAKEEEIHTIARGCLRPHEFDPDINDRKMNALYRKAVTMMEEKQLFLDDDFDLESFSRKLLSNKSYLSKTVNVMSGRNFRQFVNSYRVEYALGLMTKDRNLKMEEVALMSGFHTVVSFNMAFKLFYGETPSDWMRGFRAKE